MLWLKKPTNVAGPPGSGHTRDETEMSATVSTMWTSTSQASRLRQWWPVRTIGWCRNQLVVTVPHSVKGDGEGNWLSETRWDRRNSSHSSWALSFPLYPYALARNWAPHILLFWHEELWGSSPSSSLGDISQDSRYMPVNPRQHKILKIMFLPAHP